MIRWNSSTCILSTKYWIARDYTGLEVPSFRSYVTSSTSEPQTADKTYKPVPVLSLSTVHMYHSSTNHLDSIPPVTDSEIWVIYPETHVADLETWVTDTETQVTDPETWAADPAIQVTDPETMGTDPEA